MNILAVDTCLQPGSLALSWDDAPSSGSGAAPAEPEVVALPPGWRSVALHEEIRQLLARHNLTTANIDLYAVTAGPGAFTGVRLGLTAVKGLAEVHDKPIIVVSTLETLAFAGSPKTFRAVTVATNMARVSPAYHLAPVLDARRGQVFAAVYKVSRRVRQTLGQPGIDEDFLSLIPDSVCSLRSFLDQIKSLGINIGPQFLRFCVTDEALLLPAFEEFGWTADSVIRLAPELAEPLARMAAERFRQGKGIGALAADANYVRASDAELFWKE